MPRLILPVCLHDKIFETIKNFYKDAQSKKDNTSTLALGAYVYLYNQARHNTQQDDRGIKTSPVDLAKKLGAGYGERALYKILSDLEKMKLITSQQNNKNKLNAPKYYRVEYFWKSEKIETTLDKAYTNYNFILKKSFLLQLLPIGQKFELDIEDCIPFHIEVNDREVIFDPKYLYFNKEGYLLFYGYADYEDDGFDFDYTIPNIYLEKYFNLLLKQYKTGEILLNSLVN